MQAFQYWYQHMYRKFPGIFLVTEIHGEFISHILQDTNTITNNSVFYMGNLTVTAFTSETTFNLYMRTLVHVTDQWRLLPGGPCSPEGSTAGPSIKSFMKT